MSENYAQGVWDTLSKLDVSDHTKQLPKTAKRPAVDYLPWHKAWMLLKRNYPASTYHHSPDLIHKADSVEVQVVVMIMKDVGTPVVETMARLAVMDNYFNAVLMPDARAINDSRQRCLVKALAFAGLGLDLWSDDAIPVGRLNDPITQKQADGLSEMIEKSNTNADSFLKWCDVTKIEDLPRDRLESARGLLQAKIDNMKGDS